MQQRRSTVLPLAAWAALVVATALLGAWASADAASLYRRMLKPAWAPGPGVFGPVWTLLYVMMAAAICLVWRSPPSRWRTAGAVLFVLQLVANALWSWLFFAWRMGAAAYVDALVLALLVGLAALMFRKVRPLAAWLMLPYFLWVSFASALTWAVWRMNPGVL